MKLLARLRLCYQVLTTRRARDWRRVVASCKEARSAATLAEIFVKIRQAEALDTERLQVAEGVRTTKEAAQLLAQANQLIQPRLSC